MTIFEATKEWQRQAQWSVISYQASNPASSTAYILGEV
jgi:hypothetical protein